MPCGHSQLSDKTEFRENLLAKLFGLSKNQRNIFPKEIITTATRTARRKFCKAVGEDITLDPPKSCIEIQRYSHEIQLLRHEIGANLELAS